MFIVENYLLAVVLCIITMLCWGSWANTQKLASQKWNFQLYYWDYSIGVLLIALIMAFTLGSFGEQGRPFIEDLSQADSSALLSAFIGGVVFNGANLLLVIAIEITGMAVAFPVGIGLALVIGVMDNYLKEPSADSTLIFTGVILIVFAIILNAIAYKRLPNQSSGSFKGLIIALIAGVAMGFFYGFVAESMSMNFVTPKIGKLTPYTALVAFSFGIFISNFGFNTVNMYKPIAGEQTSYHQYFKLGTPQLHFIGILGGVIWGIGMGLNILASEVASPAVSYGLGQGATMVAAFWGVVIWKEFKTAPSSTSKLLNFMFLLFIIGLGLIVYSKI
ncbi:multidrug DMT transporter permease [Flammeovirga sp. SJP92]|uniref:multidrug DMT transporter permease n=1 Tax=Flammeovirga sp. SJP92 TaxID=1775430 RepID=UPI000786EB02|nr:multidrug DMT transporter permease [Flammeovirga sp. SJP92]KXX70980.1 multidrug DMT transporter permease [Flammeovirga sp. SJP92]